MDVTGATGAIAMRWRARGLLQISFSTITCGTLVMLALSSLHAQNAHERLFPQTKAAVEKILESMQPHLAGRLPVLDGFANPGEHPLDRYERGYYQATVQVSPIATGGSRVRVSVKVTAWYSDQSASHGEYELLVSNGRLEEDVLDQLAEQLASKSPSNGSGEEIKQTVAASTSKPHEPSVPQAGIAAPSAVSLGDKFSTSSGANLAAAEEASARPPASGQPNGQPMEKPNKALQAEADSLEEILKNQGHPKNLVAVKKSGTSVVTTPSLTGKPLFLASMHDEFEMLDFNRDWVHVRISGLSRGWIWRNAVEMPEGIADTEEQAGPAPTAAADLFHVVREETAPFPGDWAPLRGKTVKILSVQKVDENAKDAGPVERLAYAKFLLDKNYVELTKKTQSAQDPTGIVLIFDSADGGMIAATMATLQQWKAGTLTDSALWHKCFFDPPETFDSAEPSGSQ